MRDPRSSTQPAIISPTRAQQNSPRAAAQPTKTTPNRVQAALLSTPLVLYRTNNKPSPPTEHCGRGLRPASAPFVARREIALERLGGESTRRIRGRHCHRIAYASGGDSYGTCHAGFRCRWQTAGERTPQGVCACEVGRQPYRNLAHSRRSLVFGLVAVVRRSGWSTARLGAHAHTHHTTHTHHITPRHRTMLRTTPPTPQVGTSLTQPPRLHFAVSSSTRVQHHYRSMAPSITHIHVTHTHTHTHTRTAGKHTRACTRTASQEKEQRRYAAGSRGRQGGTGKGRSTAHTQTHNQIH